MDFIQGDRVSKIIKSKKYKQYQTMIKNMLLSQRREEERAVTSIINQISDDYNDLLNELTSS